MSRFARPAALVLLVLAAGTGVWFFATREPAVEAPAARPAVPVEETGTLDAPTLSGLPRVGRRAELRMPAERAAGGAAAQDEAEPAPRKVSLRVDVVDALTGRNVASMWNVGDPEVLALRKWDREHFGVRPNLIERRQQVLQFEEARADWERNFTVSGGALESHDLGQNDYPANRIVVRPPVGFVTLENHTSLDTLLVADARALTLLVPVVHEAVLEVVIRGPDGRPAEGAVLQTLSVGGKRWPPHVEHLGPGSLRIRGIPHLAGEPVAAGIEWRPKGDGQTLPSETPEDEDGPKNLKVTIPDRLDSPWAVVLDLSGSTGSLADRTQVDFDWKRNRRDATPRKADGAAGTLRLRILGWDGAPLRNVRLPGTVTDAQGMATITALAAQQQDFLVRVPGRLPIRCSVNLRPSEVTTHEAREPVGARLEVAVVDEDGRPRPTALLQIRGATFFDVEVTTQRVDLFTDHLGRRSISRVEPGEAEIHASWGSRKGFEKVTLVDGETTRVRIVAR